MNRKMGEKHLDNKGMSLVEVIVAVTILSLVIVPTLNAITTAMVYNAKAKKRQSATLVAETIMETFKGYDLDTLDEMFANNGVDSDGNNFFGSVVYSKSGVAYSKSGTAYSITDLSSNGKSYDVDIAVELSKDANLYVQYDKDKSSTAEYVGSIDISTNIEGKAIDDFVGSVNSENRDAFINALNQEYSKATYIDGTPITADNIKLSESNINIVDRTYSFKITKEDDSENANAKITAMLEYRYYIKDFVCYTPVDFKDPYPGEEKITVAGVEKTFDRYPIDTDEYLTLEVEISGTDAICQDIKAADLKAFYIYYFPFYRSGTKDNIKIDNSLGKEVECYVIKQKDTSVSEITCKNEEEAYTPNLEISDKLIVYHNLNINLGTNKEFNSKKIGTISESIHDLSEPVENTDILYNITVNVKDAGTDNVVSTLTSVMYEK
jgi:prepilin-type N-terminal cleavage/methylation domain-containing protein